MTLVEKINGSRFTFGVWVAPGTIIFDGPGTAGLKQLPADGGSPTTLTSVDVAQGEIVHYPGTYAPEAGAVVFTTAFSQLRDTQLEALIVESRERRVITENARAPKYLSTGHLMFTRGDAMLVAPIDVKRLVLAGPAVALADDVRRDGANSEGRTPQAAVSSNGTLAYVRKADAAARVMGRVGRAGVFAPFGLAAGPIWRPRVSPDGQRVAFLSPRSGSDSAFETALHVHDLVRGTVTILTEAGAESQTVWRPDGKAIAVYSTRPEVSGIYLKDLGGQDHLVFRNEDPLTDLVPESFSPDGAVLAFSRNVGGQYRIWLLTPDENRWHGRSQAARPPNTVRSSRLTAGGWPTSSTSASDRSCTSAATPAASRSPCLPKGLAIPRLVIGLSIGHSLHTRRRPMDETVRRFRRQASHELGDRQGAERRYSLGLRQVAVAYWRQRERAGDGVQTVATALGVAPVSLRRWAQDDRFGAVHVVPDPEPPTPVSVVLDGERLRIEGLDLETAVRLIARLR